MEGIHRLERIGAGICTCSIGFEVVFGIARYPQVAFFNVRDPDGNIITVSQDL